ncbi:MAG: hypothetical protein JNL98_37370 [Bryobacterales bacterium]|nr:hypothetical protein [Bryobacterales bacterium]
MQRIIAEQISPRASTLARGLILPQNGTMDGRQCYHCKQWIGPGEEHDCWTTTEQALLRGLPEDLRDAYERIRETAEAFGEQRIYASHNSIMFSRKSCYFFVRPQRKFLEVCIFLSRSIEAPQIRRVLKASKIKLAHMLRITHRDEVESPFTDWLREAYQLGDALTPRPASPKSTAATKRTARKPRTQR